MNSSEELNGPSIFPSAISSIAVLSPWGSFLPRDFWSAPKAHRCRASIDFTDRISSSRKTTRLVSIALVISTVYHKYLLKYSIIRYVLYARKVPMSRTNTSCPSHTESDSTTTKLYQFQLLLSRPTFDLGFAFLCRRSIGMLFGMHDFYGSLCSRVVSPLSLLMLCKTTFEISGNASVERLVGALQDVDEIHMLALRNYAS